MRFMFCIGDPRRVIMRAPKLSVVLAATILAACHLTSFGRPRGSGASFQEYRESFAAAAGDAFIEQLDQRELRRRARQQRTVWLGDHHRHSRLHALHLELLSELERGGAKITLLLEAVGTQDQPIVDAYLAGQLDMRALRANTRARWRGSWLDDPALDPAYFRSLLSFAREREIPVRALEPTPRGPLATRDTILAGAVAAARAAYSDRLLVVVLGQSHLLGEGDVVRRSGAGGLVVGGQPTSPLMQARPARALPGSVWRSNGDVYWFGEMLRD